MIITPVNAPEFVASALAASPLFAGAGIVVFDPDQPALGSGIIVDDGKIDLTAGVESALTSKGLCLVVGQFDECALADQVDGACTHITKLTVYVREGIARNRSTSGTGIRCDAAAVEVVRAIISTPTGSHVARRFGSGSIKNQRSDDGTWVCLVQVTIPTVIR